MSATFLLLAVPCLAAPQLPGAQQPAAPNVSPLHPHARVFVLHGTGYVFSPGLNRLCTDLHNAGLRAEDLRCVGDRWLCRELIAEHRSGKPSGPIILVGHSRGGRHVLYAARELEKAGIAVDLVVCLDVAMPSTVPGNVGQTMNLYLGGPRIYPAAPLQSDPGSAGRVENLDLNAPGSPVDARGLHHLNVSANSSVHDIVLERILQVASGSR